MRDTSEKIEYVLRALVLSSVCIGLSAYLYVYHITPENELYCSAGPGGYACTNDLVGLLTFTLLALAWIIFHTVSKLRGD